MTRRSLQRGQKRRSVIQKSRSREFNTGRGRWRFQHGDLLAEGEDFQGCVAPTAEENADHREYGKDEFEHGFIVRNTA